MVSLIDNCYYKVQLCKILLKFLVLVLSVFRRAFDSPILSHCRVLEAAIHTQ